MLAATYTLAGLLVIAGGWLKTGRPIWRKWRRGQYQWQRDKAAVRATLIGSPAVFDAATGEERAPEILGIAKLHELLSGKVEFVIAQNHLLDGRLGLMDGRVALIEHELRTNNGSSIKDAVKRIEDRLEVGIEAVRTSDESNARHFAEGQSDRDDAKTTATRRAGEEED